jgi:UDP-N-acetylmuramoyl-tripeptide--D-alanyl-D-alanine ligase
MKEIINLIFPFKLHLHILQLEEYKPARYLNWIFRNFSVRKINVKKPLVVTSKVKYLISIYIFLCVISLFIHISLFLLLLLEPYIGLTIAVFILKPYEIYNRRKTIENTRKKVLSFKNLKVIGITGSFGKSSTKEILYQLIKNKYKTLRTPESYNTVFGVAKVIDFELDESYEYFICEMAAYKIGEIKELCYMVPPDFGILTGITTQHFERFGSLANTIKAKFELVDAIKDKTKIVFNLIDDNIRSRTNDLKIDRSQTIEARNIKFNKSGSQFDLIINKNNYKINTSLFGMANIKNIIFATRMAFKVGLSAEEIYKSLANLKSFDNRLVLMNYGDSVVVNNTYSSNPQGFRETIETAKKVTGKKVLVTPGLVELGELETKIHKELGSESRGVFDKIILVGVNNRTKSFSEGIENYEFIGDNRKEYFEKVEELKKKFNWIFLENDLTENY